jgi:hypothetical protein
LLLKICSQIDKLDLGYAYDFFEMIKEADEGIQIDKISYNEKIRELFNKKIVTPIVEDFMRYHKDIERYDRYISETYTKKDDTKIKYIVNKLNKISEYYSDRVYNNENARKNVEKLLYIPLSYKRATIINDIEEVRIIDKIIKMGRNIIEKNDFLVDLVNYRSYPFVNFKDFKKYGFSIKSNNTIDVIRDINFEDHSNKLDKLMELRVASDDMNINVIGVTLNKFWENIDILRCAKIGDYTDVRNIQSDDDLPKDNAYLKIN